MEDVALWLRDFMEAFRRQSEELSQNEKQRISNLDNFLPPCQILVLWFGSVDLQYLICIHDSNRPDMEIEIKGPVPTHEAIDMLDAVLKDPKWDRGLSADEQQHVFDKTIKFSRILEDHFLNMVYQIRSKPFQKPPAPSSIAIKYWLTSKSFIWTIWGNIAEMDKAKIIAEILEKAKKDAASTKIEPPTPPQPKPLINSCVTYFYPPIWIGELPERTFKEKARGTSVWPEKALGLKYKDRVLVINNDGLIAIGEENIPKATRMLNEIMAAFLLMGINANAVRELEVCDAKINPSSLTITQWGTRAHTLRTQLYHFSFSPLLLEDRIQIRKEDIVRAIEQAERITKDPDISDFLIFFLESHTHLQNSEYSQSFIMSWVIIERHILWLWNKFLKEEQVPRERRSKLTNPAYWTIDFVLEGLHLGGQLSQKDYEDLMALKNKRNDIIHLGESATLGEAEKCFKISGDIVKRRSDLEKRTDSV